MEPLRPPADTDGSTELEGGGVSQRLRRIIFFSIVGVVLLGGGAAAFFAQRSSRGPSQTEVRDALVAAMSSAQSEAEGTSSRRFDVTELRGQLGAVAEGYLIDLAAADDRTVVGAAARQKDGTGCVLVWSAVGGPESFSYDDPALPCRGKLALAAAG